MRRPFRNHKGDLLAVAAGSLGCIALLVVALAGFGALRAGFCAEQMPALGSYRQDFYDVGCLRGDEGPILVFLHWLYATPYSRASHIYQGGPEPAGRSCSFTEKTCGD